MEMTNEIIDMGNRLKTSDPEIGNVIDRKMTDIMYLVKHKLHEQETIMKMFLQELQQRVSMSYVVQSSLFE
ncbi:hypothetical protein BJP34_16885 [Moorena producens PAL-8-15-08-1]|uniref:Uncharacterized protein n=1 Tax=Moorena producens PAL-8-15-08-1 TaxID=1458985 RepID=A0A1D8TTV2_9CYAN|nr:hypothetical protein BJP34_16885 [Moorena producens PAL-8-15-08-1]